MSVDCSALGKNRKRPRNSEREENGRREWEEGGREMSTGAPRRDPPLTKEGPKSPTEARRRTRRRILLLQPVYARFVTGPRSRRTEAISGGF